jgi:membrane-associated phospholipid phosphatase
MKHIWQHRWFFVPVAVCWAGCLAVALVLPYGDEIHFFNEARQYAWLNETFMWLTHLGEEWAFLAIGVAMLFWRPRYAALIALAGLLSMSVGYVFKDLAGVDRPITYFEKAAPPAVQPVLVPGVVLNRGQTSFPSGHTTAAFALYSLVAMMTAERWRKIGLLLAALAVLTAVSRVFLVQHFLADVLAGTVLGMLLGAISWYAGLRWMKGPVAVPPPVRKSLTIVELAKNDFLPKIAAGQTEEGVGNGHEVYAAAASLVPALLSALGKKAGDRDFVEALHGKLKEDSKTEAAHLFQSAFGEKWEAATFALAAFARTSPETVRKIAPEVSLFAHEAMRAAVVAESLTPETLPEYLRYQSRAAETLTPSGVI